MNEEMIKQVANQLGKSEGQVTSVLNMLKEGNTVPFIARYRKEATGALNEDEIREIEKVYDYAVNLNTRKDDVIRLIEEKGMMNDNLKKDILACTKLSEVEDLYRPFKEKKKTRATVAKAKGLEPLSDWIWKLPRFGSLEEEAKKYLNDEVKNVEEAIAGALDIIAEIIADHPRNRQFVKQIFYHQGMLVTKEKKKHEDEDKVYEMYYDYHEKVDRIVAHRILAVNRAEKEKVISVNIEVDEAKLLERLLERVLRKRETIVVEYLRTCVKDAYKRLIAPSIEREIRSELTEMAENQALNIFSINLEKLLLQAPMKDRMVLGVDPAIRTGCKLAVVDVTGKVLKIDKIFPTIPKKSYADDKKKVLELISKYKIEIIAIGNGTASRETEKFIADLIKEKQLDVSYVIVSEAGASVYSASPIAKEEFPEFQVEERSAVSIARRLQDPLAELVKIEPKAISVGQYQHDMNQKKLEEQLDYVVMKTVNRVGINVNTASTSLLKYVAGLSNQVAKSIVAYRDEHGKFTKRKELGQVPRLGAKTYEQAVGFLRIIDGDEPLDKTAIHPESYQEAYALLAILGITTDDIGKESAKIAVEKADKIALQTQLNIDEYTLNDILEAFVNPTRTPRDHYATPILKQDVLHLEDLKEGMQLDGTVRNVVDFGAFVDIGLKNDGLVHISKICKEFIKHPLEKVNVGDIVTVYVEKVDLNKKKVSLTMIP
jgi:Transcriptional accessory protein